MFASSRRCRAHVPVQNARTDSRSERPLLIQRPRRAPPPHPHIRCYDLKQLNESMDDVRSPTSPALGGLPDRLAAVQLDAGEGDADSPRTQAGKQPISELAEMDLVSPTATPPLREDVQPTDTQRFSPALKPAASARLLSLEEAELDCALRLSAMGHGLEPPPRLLPPRKRRRRFPAHSLGMPTSLRTFLMRRATPCLVLRSLMLRRPRLLLRCLTPR